MRKIIFAVMVVALMGCGEFNNNQHPEWDEMASKPHSYNWSRFDGGLNDSNDPMDVQPHQLTAVQNVIPDGGSIRRRPGFGRYPAETSPAQQALGLYEYIKNDGTQELVGIFTDGKAYKIASDVWVTGAPLKTGLSTTTMYAFATMNNSLLITSASLDLNKYNGATWTGAGGSPVGGQFLQVFQNFLFILHINVAGSKNRARFSAINDFETWNASDEITFGDYGDIEITGHGVIGNVLVVLTNAGIYEVQLTAGDFAFIKRPMAPIGCYKHTAQVVDGDSIIFASSQGAYRYRPGGQLDLITKDKIENTWKTLVTERTISTAHRSAYISKSNQYILAVDNTGGGNVYDYFLMYDVESESWWPFLPGNEPSLGITYLTTVKENASNIYSDDILWMSMYKLNGVGACFKYTPNIWGDAGEQYTDESMSGLTPFIESFAISTYAHWNRPDILKKFGRSMVGGQQINSNNIAVSLLSVHRDGSESTTVLGNTNFYVSGGAEVYRPLDPGSAGNQSRMIRWKFAETGATDENSAWKINSIGVQALMLGVN